MILSIGSDIVDIRRVDYLLQRFGNHFTQRIFTESEITAAETLPEHRCSAYYAKRFAAKEACAKALGVGIGAHIAFRDITVIGNTAGQPSITLTGVGAVTAAALTPKNIPPHIYLSLSDEYPYALAFVVIATE